VRFSRAQRLDLVVALALIVATACSGGTPIVTHSPSVVQGALSEGLIAYLGDKGVGVLDPTSGKSTLVAPLPAGGAFRASGPVWATAPGVPYPVLYFTIHDDRPAESRTTPPGVIPYDWLFRADPFAGTVEPLAASADLQSEGPFGLVANARYLALTTGCCANYEVDALDLTRPSAGLKVLAKPPTQAALFTEGAAPGPDGLIAVRVVGTGAWYWLNASAAVLNPFPLSPGPEDGPIAISADGTLAAISLPDQGPIIEPINVATPVASPSPVTSGTAAPAATPTHASPVPSAAPRHVNSKLPHADGLAWSPDAKQLALAVNGEIEIYAANGADGAAPVGRYLTGNNVVGIDWSGPISHQSLALVKPDTGPQSFVDALVDETKLPAAADTAANRPLTKVYLWQFDSSRPSPIATIADATPAILQQYPPLPARVSLHHWAASNSWQLLGGCFRYRVVITGSVAPTASTIGLASNAACNAPAVSPTPSPSPTK
jgi:hypothetical protein